MPSIIDQFLGTKPKVPTLPTLDLGAEQQKAIGANQAALPGAEQLVSKANQFSRDQITQMLQSVFPGLATTEANISQNIEDLTAGKIPKDVQDAIQNSAAARAIGGGFAGSGAHSDLVARDLGLTSLDLTQRGLASAESWMRTAASLYEPSMINVASMFISPQQEASFDVEERNAQFQRQWMENQIKAMPAPWSADVHQLISEVLSVYSGTQTQGNPYFRGVSGGGVGGSGGFGNYQYSPGAGEGGSGFDPGVAGAGGGGADFAGELGI